MSHLPTRHGEPGPVDSRKPIVPVVSQFEMADLDNDGSGGADKPSENVPRALKSTSSMITGFLFDILGILVAITILIFAVVGYRADQNIISEKESRLLSASRIVATTFPYVFALILGRALRSALAWRLEKGVDCLSFAYLSRSLTLGGAFTVPLHLRCLHWLPPLLLVIWGFSPLGSQALLRFVSLQHGIISEELSQPLQYSYPAATWNSACGDCKTDAHNSITMASFLSLGTSHNRSQDTWGNLKIPMVNDDLATDTEGWAQLSELTTPQYTSLIGIPSAPIRSTSNITFLVQSWYWQLDNASLWRNGSSGPLLTSTPDYPWPHKLNNYTSTNKLWQFALPEELNTTTTWEVPLTWEASPSTVQINNAANATYYYGTNGPVSNLVYYGIRLEASLTQRPVELNVSCVLAVCEVTAIRKAAMNASYSTENDRHYLKSRFFDHLSAAFPREHSGTEYPNVLQAYLFDPTKNPYTHINGESIDLTDVDALTLARRLSQVINTHWIADNYFANAAGAFDAQGNIAMTVRNASVTSTSNRDILHCDRTWFTLLCISTLVMLAAAAAAPILRSMCGANDTTDFLSAMMLHKSGDILNGRTYLDANERTRLIRDVRLKVGDGKPDDAIGKVVIGQEAHVASFRGRKLYM